MPLGWLDQFEVLRLLGRGGMSDVYLAHESHLDCDVALKILRDDHARDAADRSRLLGEARALARLDHPNIIGILGCGEAAPRPAGFLWPDQPGPYPERVVYLAMRYVEGQDLSGVIRDRRLSPASAVGYAIQIARGLEAAHAQGVVHRDLKPANIRVTHDDVLKLVDFGLASAHRRLAGSESPTEPMTRDVILGTVGYSAPEQGGDAGHADPRCDLFSLGVILYEMVAGQRPFEGVTTLEVLREIATVEPPPLARFAREVPPELERIVGKLLQKDPKRRYASAHDVLVDLESLPLPRPRPRLPLPPRLAWAVLGAVVLATLFGVPLLCRPAPPETVAVAEFENLTGDPSLDRIARGIGLDLVTSLVQACRVNVVVSALRDGAGQPVRDPARVAKEYGASTVLLGALHFEGSPGPVRQFSLHVRLVRARDNTTRWAHDWNAAAGDVAELVPQVAGSVVELWPRAPGAEARALDGATSRPAGAEEAYLAGRALLEESDPAARDSAFAAFDRALALDPSFGRAYAGRARARLAAFLRDRDTTRLAPAERDARSALAMPASETEGRLALARILRERSRLGEAAEQLRAVLRENDRNADACAQLGTVCAQLGDRAAARAYFRRSLALQPGWPRLWRAYGIFLMQNAASLPEAEEAFRSEIRLAPGKNRGYEDLAATLVVECRYAEAIAMYARLPRPEEGSLDRAGNRGVAYYFAGDYARALHDFLDAVGEAPDDGNWRINLGDCYARLGRRADALAEYQRAEACFARDRAVRPGDVGDLVRHAKSLAKAGALARARAEADSAIAAGPWGDADVIHDLAMTLVLAGDRARGLDALDTLVRGRGASTCLLRIEDEFASVRGDPRFRALISEGRR